MEHPVDPIFYYVLAVLEFISLCTCVHLWRRVNITVSKKFIWTMIILIPVIGPLAYGGLFDVPPPTDKNRKHWQSPNKAY